jgi:hypothetical protein
LGAFPAGAFFSCAAAAKRSDFGQYPDSKEKVVPSFPGAKQQRIARDEELERIAGPEKSSPTRACPTPCYLVKIDTLKFRVFILVRSPPQAGMRPNFKIHRFNAVWIRD